jgi:hypothetical protein
MRNLLIVAIIGLLMWWYFSQSATAGADVLTAAAGSDTTGTMGGLRSAASQPSPAAASWSPPKVQNLLGPGGANVPGLYQGIPADRFGNAVAIPVWAQPALLASGDVASWESDALTRPAPKLRVL